MLNRLISKAGFAAGAGRVGQTPLPPPDISRVIKPWPPVTAALLAEETEARAGDAEQALENLSEQFEAWMRRDLSSLREAWAAAREPEAPPETYRQLYTAAHNISGAAPSYGFPVVSRLSRSLCTLLSQTRPGENTALINLHVEACRAAIAAGAQGEASHYLADAVCQALEERVALRVAG
jgi:hypothetical protein